MSRFIPAALGLTLLLLAGCDRLPGIPLPSISMPTLSKPPPAPTEPAHMIMDTPAGRILASHRGMTLYVSATDIVAGQSTCNDTCTATWPPLVALDDAKPAGEWSVVVRSDGLKQWAYGGKPLHGWHEDKKPGDVLGNGQANGRWAAATPDIGTEAYATRQAAVTEGRAPCDGIVAWDRVRFETAQISRYAGDEFDSGDIALTTYIFRPSSAGRAPVIVYNHGSTGPGLMSAKTRMFPSCEAIRFFTDNGYAIVAPNRRGRGESAGTYMEECGDCPPTRYYSYGVRGLNEAVRDLDAVTGFLATQSYVDTGRILMAGPGRGGFLSVIYAGERPHKVKAVLNFAGGWFDAPGERRDEYAEFNIGNLRRAARMAQMPMLWLYRDKDRRHAAPLIRAAYQGFRESGGDAELLLYTNEPGKDGHNLMFEQALWSADVKAFLDRVR